MGHYVVGVRDWEVVGDDNDRLIPLDAYFGRLAWSAFLVALT